MKTKQIIIISSIVMLTGIAVSCNARLLNSERKITKQLQKEDIHINSQLLESITGNRQINLTDSSSNVFKVTIFPLDTFTFSLESGFKGKAMRIEATGVISQLKKISDSSELLFEKETRLEYDNNRNVLKVVSNKTRIIERKRVSWVLGITGLALISFLVWLWWKRGQRVKVG